MGFQEVLDLDCGTTISLGGFNKKTRKDNPTKFAGGYFIGSKETPNKMSKNGFAYLHIFQTENGNVGVWGKTDLDRKMRSVPVGAMTRITVTGSVPTDKGNDMIKFKVEVDTENSIDVNLPKDETTSEDQNQEASGEDTTYEEAETSLEAEEQAPDETPPARPSRPAQAAQAPSADRQAKVKALLSGGRQKSA